MSDTIMPCPFCGGEVHESQFQARSLWNRELVTWHRIYCSVCDIGMNECADYEALLLRWNHRKTKEDADTITIPRDLFERLCEAAIELQSEKSWRMKSVHKRYVEQQKALCSTVEEAVAIRDRVKISQPS